MFQGLRTVVYHVDDIEHARNWYSQALGIEPYFDQPFYVGFNIGGYELGLQPTRADRTPNPYVVAYWGVAEIEATLARLVESGATLHSDLEDVGDNIRLAVVLDPFGNAFGIIDNPNFKLP